MQPWIQRGILDNVMGSYFAEYITRRKFLQCSADPLLKFFRLISLVYCPPTEQQQQQQPSQPPSLPALFAAAPQRISAAAEPEPDNMTFRSQDIANFDLGFDLSDSDSADFDTSADLFA